jgi:NTE family protein
LERKAVEITLALGGGGSKGYAHLGVFRALENLGYQIKAIAGTSAGGVAAAVYAAGYSPDEIIEKASQIRQDSLFGFGRGPAILGDRGIKEAFSQFLGDETFADLNIPCALTAVDIKNKQEVVLREGRVLDAIMATIAIPGIFPPLDLEDRILVDGMVLDPVPVRVARSLAPDLPVIAVTLTPDPETWKEISPWGTTPENPLLRTISRLRVAKAFEIYLRSMDMTVHELGELRLKMEKPDLVIRPNVAQIGQLDRVDPREVARLGEQAVEECQDELKKLKEGR